MVNREMVIGAAVKGVHQFHQHQGGEHHGPGPDHDLLRRAQAVRIPVNIIGKQRYEYGGEIEGDHHQQEIHAGGEDSFPGTAAAGAS